MPQQPFTTAMSRSFRAVAFAAVALAAPHAWASDASEHPDWELTVAAEWFSYPEYPGSDHTKSRLYPVIEGRYGEFFIGDPVGDGRTSAAGYRLVDEKPWQVSVYVGSTFTNERVEADDPRLRGLGDIDYTTRAGIAVSYAGSWFKAQASASQDIGGNGQGLLVKMIFNAGFQPTPQWTVHAGPVLTWGNARYVQTLYGIDAQQSARSGRAAYSAHGGVTRLGLGVGTDYDITPRWSLGANFTLSRLQGDAGDSPLVVRRRQNSAIAYLSYDF